MKVLEILSYPFCQLATNVESEVQAWLNDNPHASIEHVAQPPVAVSEGTLSLLVTLFYRD